MNVRLVLLWWWLVGTCSAGDGYNVGDVRLVNDDGILTESFGIAQVFMLDGWYTVIFDELDRATTVVSVLCRQLTFVGALNYTIDNSFGYANYKYIGNMECYDVEIGNVLRCPYRLYKVPGEHHLPLRIGCNTTSILQHAYNGQVYINSTNGVLSDGIVKIVLDELFLPVCGSKNVLNQYTADSICRQLGYSTALAFEAFLTKKNSSCWRIDVDSSSDDDSSHSCLTHCFEHYSHIISDSNLHVTCVFDTQATSPSAGNEQLCAIASTGGSNSSHSTVILLSVFTVIVTIAIICVCVIILVHVALKYQRRQGYEPLPIDQRRFFAKDEFQVDCAPAAT